MASAFPEAPPPGSTEQQKAAVAIASSQPLPAPLPPTSSAQQQPRLSSAATRPVSRQQGGQGQRYGLRSMLAAWNDIAIDIADQSLQHTPAPELLLRVESEFMTPDTNELA